MRRINPINIAYLLLLFWTSQIPITGCAFRPVFQELSSIEQIQITNTLKFLDVYNRRSFVFKKKEQDPYVLGTARDFYFYCYVELSPEAFLTPYFKPVLYHEIGHCLGLDHTKNPNDIMYENAHVENQYSLSDWQRFFSQLRDCF